MEDSAEAEGVVPTDSQDGAEASQVGYQQKSKDLITVITLLLGSHGFLQSLKVCEFEEKKMTWVIKRT